MSFPQDADHPLAVAHEDAFGDLQLHPLRRQTGLPQQGGNAGDDLVAEEQLGRKVDGHADRPRGFGVPLPGGGEGISPASISPWQLAHTRTHLLASARYAASDLPLPIWISNDFSAGAT